MAYDALREAIQMAWMQDPQQRPSARQISNHLLKAILAIQGTTTGDDPTNIVDMVRVVVPPLPPNHRYTDSDFNENFAYASRDH